MSRPLTWGQLIAACKVHGKERVLAVLQAQTDALEGLQAHLYGGDTGEVHLANNMSTSILRRLETMIRLRAMTDADMDAQWATATKRQQQRWLAMWNEEVR